MRLTKRIGEHVYYTLGKYPETLPAECETADVRAILKALATYEDIGEPEELVKPVRCRECRHMEIFKGRLLCNRTGQPRAVFEEHYCSYREREEADNE